MLYTYIIIELVQKMRKFLVLIINAYDCPLV